MKNLGVILVAGCLLIFSQCGQSTKAGEQDSLISQIDSTVSEHFISTPNALFSFESPKEDGDEALFEAFQKGLLEYQSSFDSVVFESHEIFGGSILSAGACADRTIVEVRLTIPAQGTLNVYWYVIEEVNPGMYAAYDPIVEDITEYQDETSADMSLENHLNECPVFSVRYQTEGGDIDFRSREVITFYSVEAGFNEILQVELDVTEDSEGYVEGDPEGDETFERRDFTILTTKTNGLFDIQIDYDNGSEQKTEIYAWNGTVYALK
ncbi:MAG TPA: hypothetical protein VFU05_07030, partial [Cyclobacteriaceae bacterium]|nr:hypothetical protein [Cyclobacteriaceae bacterium]